MNKSKIKITKIDTIIDERVSKKVYSSMANYHPPVFFEIVRKHKQNKIYNLKIRLWGDRAIVFDNEEEITSSYCNDRDGGYEKYTTCLCSRAIKYIPTNYEFYKFIKELKIDTDFVPTNSSICSEQFIISSDLTWEQFEELYSVFFDYYIREFKEYVEFEEYYKSKH